MQYDWSKQVVYFILHSHIVLRQNLPRAPCLLIILDDEQSMVTDYGLLQIHFVAAKLRVLSIKRTVRR